MNCQLSLNSITTAVQITYQKTAPALVICLQESPANNLRKQFGPRSGPTIWIQTV